MKKIVIAVVVLVVVVLVMAVVGGAVWMRSSAGAFSDKYMQNDLTGHCWTLERDDAGVVRPNITVCRPELMDQWTFKPNLLTRDPQTGKAAGVIQSKVSGLCVTAGTRQEGGICKSASETAKDYIYDLSMQPCDARNKKQQFIRFSAGDNIYPPKSWGTYDETQTNADIWKNIGTSTKLSPQCIAIGDNLQLEECYDRYLGTKDCNRSLTWHPRDLNHLI